MIASSGMGVIREAMAALSPAPRVEPNEELTVEQVFMPYTHRAVLDPARQLVVGNRGMGKSMWTHALARPEIRSRISAVYGYPALAESEVVIGFNGSEKLLSSAPTPGEIERAMKSNVSPDLVWRAVMYRAVQEAVGDAQFPKFEDTVKHLEKNSRDFEEFLTRSDDELRRLGKSVMVIFDALDRLAGNWEQIRMLTSALLKRAIGLKSFRAIRAKIFMRPDQYEDDQLFQFPDSSKLKNEHVNLTWKPFELYDLLLFEISRNENARPYIDAQAGISGAASWTPDSLGAGSRSDTLQMQVISAIAGQHMGADARRGRVYTWVPLHLSDARGECSPRTFLTAWQRAAVHLPYPKDKAVDHLGLIEGVRSASRTRVEELGEDYRWIVPALNTLKGHFVPMAVEELFDIWNNIGVIKQVVGDAFAEKWLAPIEFSSKRDAESLLKAMRSIGVIEVRANGKINVPDIFRVEAGIKRRGGVSVPRKN